MALEEGWCSKLEFTAQRSKIGKGSRFCWTSRLEQLARLSHVWMDAGYTAEGKGAGWVERTLLGWTAQIVRHPPKLAPEEVMRRWVKEWATQGVAIDPEKLSGPRRFGDLPRTWVVERTFWWLGQIRRMSKDYERLPESSEAFVYVAMMRLMVRRLVRS